MLDDSFVVMGRRRHLYEHVTNVFHMRVNVSIDTKLYTCEIRAYNIAYVSSACLHVCVGRALLVC